MPLEYLPIKTRKEVKDAIAEIAHNKRTSSSKWISDLLELNPEVVKEIKKFKKTCK